MKFIGDRLFSDPDAAARKLLDIVRAFIAESRLPHARSLQPQIPGRLLASIGDDLAADLRAFSERAEPGLLDGRYVDEHVLAAAIRLNPNPLVALNHFTVPVATSILPIDSKTRKDGDRNPAKERAHQREPAGDAPASPKPCELDHMAHARTQLTTPRREAVLKQTTLYRHRS
jgi:hypothetical protein